MREGDKWGAKDSCGEEREEGKERKEEGVKGGERENFNFMAREE